MNESKKRSNNISHKADCNLSLNKITLPILPRENKEKNILQTHTERYNLTVAHEIT